MDWLILVYNHHQFMKRASYTLPEVQKKYLLKKAHEMGLTQVQVLRVIMADYMERNPLK